MPDTCFYYHSYLLHFILPPWVSNHHNDPSPSPARTPGKLLYENRRAIHLEGKYRLGRFHILSSCQNLYDFILQPMHQSSNSPSLLSPEVLQLGFRVGSI
jgi:hypothetical protein